MLKKMMHHFYSLPNFSSTQTNEMSPSTPTPTSLSLYVRILLGLYYGILSGKGRPNEHSPCARAALRTCMTIACMPCGIWSLAWYVAIAPFRCVFQGPQHMCDDNGCNRLTNACCTAGGQVVNQRVCLSPLKKVADALTADDREKVLAVLGEIQKRFQNVRGSFMYTTEEYQLAGWVIGPMMGITDLVADDVLGHIETLRSMVANAANCNYT